jgi:hypothetical protein
MGGSNFDADDFNELLDLARAGREAGEYTGHFCGHDAAAAAGGATKQTRRPSILWGADGGLSNDELAARDRRPSE